MRIPHYVFLLSILIANALVPSTSFAQHNSSFGFAVPLSREWLVVTPEEVAKGFKNETLTELEHTIGDSATRENILQRIKSGKVEMYIDRRYSSEDFTNNITVQLMSTQAIPSKSEMTSLCASLPKRLTEIHGTHVTVADCGLRTDNTVTYVAYEYRLDGPGLYVIQRELPFPGGKTLVFAGGCNRAGITTMKNAYVALMQSATIHIRDMPNISFEGDATPASRLRAPQLKR